MALAAAQREAAHQKQLQMQAEQLIGTGSATAAGGQDDQSNGETTQ